MTSTDPKTTSFFERRGLVRWDEEDAVCGMVARGELREMDRWVAGLCRGGREGASEWGF